MDCYYSDEGVRQRQWRREMVTSGQESCSFPTRATDSPDVSVPEMVAVQAALAPETVAVSAGCRSLSRGALDTRANRVAWHLRSLGVGKDVLVGLCLPRSVELVVGALGILKAGGAYVPMDPSYPTERLEYMLKDAQAPILVTTPSLVPRLPSGPWKVVNIGAPQLETPCTDAPVRIKPEDLA